MNAYINKCSCRGGLSESGIFNCELHRSVNKSQISLSQVSTHFADGIKNYSTIQAVGNYDKI